LRRFDDQGPEHPVRACFKTFFTRSKNVKAIEDVSLTCEPGSFTALIGPSGCGKSTILRLALGLELADSGSVAVGGVEPKLATASGATGVAFQDSALLPWRSVESNIALPVDVLGNRARSSGIKSMI
jgi:NitT/TauT family transport system ATP-binding protein